MLFRSLAIPKSKQQGLNEVEFELTELPSTFNPNNIGRSAGALLEVDNKHTRIADQNAIDHHYLNQEPPPNPIMAEALLGVHLSAAVTDSSFAAEPNIVPATVPPSVAPTKIQIPIAEPDIYDDASTESLPPVQSLQRTLYLIEQGCELSKEGDSFHVRKDGELSLDVPARAVDHINIFGNIQLTTPAMQLAMRHGISIGLMSALGRYYGRIDSHDVSALNLQRAQFKLMDDSFWKLELSKQFVRGKLGNSRLMLVRWMRRKTLDPQAREALLRVRDAMQRIKTVVEPESLLGLEGAAAADHFAVMRLLLGPEWKFERRQRQPAPDAINALLSLGYTLLYQCVGGLLQARGLNPHAGFMHVGSSTHMALASDLMEEFRAYCVDSLVIRFCTQSGAHADRFGQTSDGGFKLDRIVVKQWVRSFEERLNAPLKHPITGENASDVRRIIDGQIVQLMRCIRHPDIATYTPCIFR